MTGAPHRPESVVAGQARVSVVMPVYNAESTMRRSIDSVLAQTHADWELLLVDDGSSDGSAGIIAGYAARDGRIRPVHQANGGVASARNAGIDIATGDYIAFLDSDDWWHPDKLALQVAAMRDQGALVSYAAYQRVAEDGRALSTVSPPAAVDYRDMLASNFIGNLTGMLDRRLGEVRFARMGHEDYVFWLECVRRAGRAVRVPSDGPLAWYLVREGSVSANKLRAASWQWRIYRDVAGLSLARASVCMLQYVVHALRKRRAEAF
nr:glycosyltransferase family 2 protein [Luteimonas aestuarii]